MYEQLIKQGIDLWESLAVTLNNIIEEQGEITINDERIWDGFLHAWDNEDWIKALVAVDMLYEQHPEYFKSFHEDAFQTARKLIIGSGGTERILDRKRNKVHAWKMIMTMRELWNAVNEVYLPNNKSSRKVNKFHEVFE